MTPNDFEDTVSQSNAALACALFTSIALLAGESLVGNEHSPLL